MSHRGFVFSGGAVHWTRTQLSHRGFNDYLEPMSHRGKEFSDTH